MCYHVLLRLHSMIRKMYSLQLAKVVAKVTCLLEVGLHAAKLGDVSYIMHMWLGSCSLWNSDPFSNMQSIIYFLAQTFSFQIQVVP